MVFCIVTFHLWVRFFKMFPELRVLAYVDDETTIGRFSQVLKLAAVSKSVCKSDVNLDFNMDKTMILEKSPTARFTHFQLIQKIMNTSTQCMSANIT
jgi:hypothetical protein